MLQLPETKVTPTAVTRGGTKIAAAFQKLETVHAKMMEAYAGDNFEAGARHLSRLLDAAENIVGMPAEKPGDMLLKIAAAGVFDDGYGRGAPLMNWQADLSGGICDHGAAKTLMALRDDLNRLLGEI